MILQAAMSGVHPWGTRCSLIGIVWFSVFATALPLRAEESAADVSTKNSAESAPATDSRDAARIVDIDDLKPSDEQLLREAVGLQGADQPARAAAVFADLLLYYPDSPFKEEVVFRLAECYRAMGRFAETEKLLTLLQDEFPKSAWLPAVALMRGEMAAASNDWQAARPHFIEASKAKKNAVQIRALFLWVVTDVRLNRLPDARSALDKLTKINKDNPHLDFALVKLAELEMREGKIAKAEPLLRRALSLTSNPEIRAEAAVRAGNAAHTDKRYADAVAYYEMVRKLEAPGAWKELAHLGLIQAHFAASQFAEVVRVFNEVRPAFPADQRAPILFMVGESQRLNGDLDASRRSLDSLLKDFPDSPLVRSALWARVLVEVAGGPDRVNAASDAAARFLARFPEAEEAPRAVLIRADAFFDQRDWKTAATMYEGLLANDAAMRDFAVDTRRHILLRAGIGAFYANADYALALQRLEAFLAKTTDASQRREALWLTGLALMKLERTAEAIQRLDELEAKHKNFDRREALLWNLASLYSSVGAYVDAKRVLMVLLNEFHSEERKAELIYWLAVTSQRLGQNQEAFDFWGRAAALDPTYFQAATRFRIDHLLRSGELAGLVAEVKSYERWQSETPAAEALSPDIHEWIAQQMESAGDIDGAETFYRRVLALKPPEVQAKRSQFKLARLMSAANRYGAAVREWNVFREQYPDDADRLEVLVPLAEACLGAADFDRARELAEQILRQNPEGKGNAEARILLGRLEAKRGQYEEAAKMFRAVALLAMDDQLAPRALVLAELAFRRAGKESEADAMLLERGKKFPAYRPDAGESL